MPQLPSRRQLAAIASFLVICTLLITQLPVGGPLSAPSIKRDWKCTPQRSGARTRRVAVIGAGSAGSSAAYYLREFAGDCYELAIDVFERNPYVGGRSTTVDVFGHANTTAELGASIFVQVNHNLVSAAERFRLSVKTATMAAAKDAEGKEDDDDGSSDRFGVWDGSSFVFLQPANESYWRTVLKMLWKYGLAPIRTQRLTKATVGAFLKLYEPPVFPFASLSESAHELGLTTATTQLGSAYLSANGITPPFSTDLIQASTRVNYAQNLGQIHGLETMVCMATDGAMAVAGGNWRIFDAMLAHSEAHVRLEQQALSITKHADGGYEVIFAHVTGEAKQSLRYDDVVIAAPYQFSGISLPEDVERVPDEIEYVKLQVTLFTTKHRLQPQYFNKTKRSEVPGTILTTLPGDAYMLEGAALNSSHEPHDFLSISTLAEVINPKTGQNEYLYKMFSRERVTAELLQRLFLGSSEQATEKGQTDEAKYNKDGVTSWKHEKLWHSYPYLPPRITYDEPALTPDGLWYTAGIESFISTMETSSLMGMNVARLMVDRWQAQDLKQVDEGLVMAGADQKEEKEKVKEKDTDVEVDGDDKTWVQEL